jgi:hypothetical protein
VASIQPAPTSDQGIDPIGASAPWAAAGEAAAVEAGGADFSGAVWAAVDPVDDEHAATNMAASAAVAVVVSFMVVLVCPFLRGRPQGCG